MILWKIRTPGFEILEKSFFLVMARETVSNPSVTSYFAARSLSETEDAESVDEEELSDSEFDSSE